MSRQKRRLRVSMSETDFDNGYWYATELRDFAITIGIPFASRLRKDELERVVKQFIRSGRVPKSVPVRPSKAGVRDVDRGLRLDLPVVNYTSNRETKAFLEREAAKLVPGFRRASGTRYLLNRWREKQLAAGRPITYRDLVEQVLVLNETKRGPLRVEHGRYINFISDFSAAHTDASRADALRAWRQLKAMNAPKTYASWAKRRR
jgi:SAP domain-containing protein